MDVIATVRRDKERFDDQKHFIDKIGLLLKHNVSIFRFNIEKWKKKELEFLKFDIDTIREIYKDYSFKIMLDIPFPGKKCRCITKNKVSLDLKQNEILRIVNDEQLLDENTIMTTFGKNITKISLNDEVTYGEGSGKLRITKASQEAIEMVVLNDFVLEHSKSLLFTSSVEKNYDSLDYLLPLINNINPEIVALSFVEDAADVNYFRNAISNKNIEIMAKIETISGVNNIDSIIASIDSVMVARGDLGLNVPLEKFGEIEEALVKKAKNNNKLVYIATDILNSMVNKKIPTRADLIDLYFSKKLGANGIMLTYGLVRSDFIEDALILIKKQCMI